MVVSLTCDDEVLVLSAHTKIKGVAHVVPVDEDGEVGVLYHGDGLTHYDQTDLKCQTNDWTDIQGEQNKSWWRLSCSDVSYDKFDSWLQQSNWTPIIKQFLSDENKNQEVAAFASQQFLF